MDKPIAHDSLCLGHLPARHARYRPRHTALVVPPGRSGEHEVRLTWRELDAFVNRWANALAGLGVARGDRVATVLGNGLPLLASYWSCAKLGAVMVPMSPLLTASGAGAASRFSIGLVVVAGMSIGTLFTLFVLPAVYVAIATDHSRTAETKRAKDIADFELSRV